MHGHTPVSTSNKSENVAMLVRSLQSRRLQGSARHAICHGGIREVVLAYYGHITRQKGTWNPDKATVLVTPKELAYIDLCVGPIYHLHVNPIIASMSRLGQCCFT